MQQVSTGIDSSLIRETWHLLVKNKRAANLKLQTLMREFKQTCSQCYMSNLIHQVKSMSVASFDTSSLRYQPDSRIGLL